MSFKENISVLNQTIANSVPESLRSAFENTLSHIMGAESGGSRTAKSSTSSATGVFQFTKGTWDQVAKGKDIYNVQDQCDAAVKYTLDNRKTLLKSLGREPTSGELYLAHFAGDGTAAKILHAATDTPITSLMSPKAINANRSIRFRGKNFADFTASDLESWAAAKMNADLGARRDYQTAHDAGKTTKEQDEQESKERNRLLQDFGVPQPLIEMISNSGILGKLFLTIIQMFIEQATPPNERSHETQVVSADHKIAVVPHKEKKGVSLS